MLRPCSTTVARASRRPDPLGLHGVVGDESARSDYFGSRNAGEDGFWFIRQVRGLSPPVSAVPAVALTGWTAADPKRRSPGSIPTSSNPSNWRRSLKCSNASDSWMANGALRTRPKDCLASGRAKLAEPDQSLHSILSLYPQG